MRELLAALACGFLTACCCDSPPVLPGDEPIPTPIRGPEDIEPVDAHTFIVSCRDLRGPDVDRSGALYLFNLDGGGVRFADLTTSVIRTPFHPHGISAWRDGDRMRLFVVNHRCADDVTIEVLDYSKSSGTLTHVATSEDSSGRMENANDVVAIDDRRFFVTAPGGLDGKVLWCEDALAGRLPYRVMVGRLGYPNGIALNPDHTQLYFTTSLDDLLHWCDVRFDPVTHQPKLESESSRDLGFVGDNITIAQDGCLWIAGDETGLGFELNHLGWRKNNASQAVRVAVDSAGRPMEMTRVFCDRWGCRQSAASVIVPFDDGERAVLGSVWDGLLVTEIEKGAK